MTLSIAELRQAESTARQHKADDLAKAYSELEKEWQEQSATEYNFGKNGKLIKFPQAEFERAIRGIASLCPLDLKQRKLIGRYRHNATQSKIADVREVCYGFIIGAFLENGIAISEVPFGDEVWNCDSDGREFSFVHSVAESLFSCSLVLDDYKATKTKTPKELMIRAIKSNNRRHKLAFKNFAGWAFSDFRESDGKNDNKAYTPTVLQPAMVAKLKELQINHKLFNLFEPVAVAAKTPPDNSKRAKFVSMACPKCDPKLDRVDKINSKNKTSRICSRKQNKKVCDTALVTTDKIKAKAKPKAKAKA